MCYILEYTGIQGYVLLPNNAGIQGNITLHCSTCLLARRTLDENIYLS